MGKVRNAYKQGFIDGLTAYAWWLDGEQRVGNSSTKLRDAIENVEKTYNFNPPEEDDEV